MRGIPAVLGVALMFTSSAAAQDVQLDSLLRAHSHEVLIESGRLAGPGAEVILEAAAGAQFVGVLEEHNVGALAEFTTSMFRSLHDAYGFRYLVLEQGPIIMGWLTDDDRRGRLDAIADLVARYPHAPTFATDQELEMIARVGNISDAEFSPVWGIDQEFGALHILERLQELAPNDAARDTVGKLIRVARRYDGDRTGDTLYLSQVATPADFASLPGMFEDAGAEASRLLEELQRTGRIYYNWYRGAVLKEPTGYENSREREHSMKLRFLEMYHQAERTDGSLPRVVAKMGHWHLFRGIYRGNVPTFGNFLSEFAISNGMTSFLISTHVVESPEDWRNTRGALAGVAREGTFTLLDFRLLRPYAHQGSIADLDEELKRLIFRADAALIVRGGATGDYRIVQGLAPSSQ